MVELLFEMLLTCSMDDVTRSFSCESPGLQEAMIYTSSAAMYALAIEY